MKTRFSKHYPVLDCLRGTSDHFVSGEDISKKLGISRAAVWKEIEALRGIGYRIDAQPHAGYRLLQAPDKLFADEIAFGLRAKLVGRSLICYEELDSTNDTTFRLGESGAAEGVCVFTEHQKKGRGRLGRRWESPKGQSLLFSVLLRPRLAPGDLPKITLTAAVAVVKAVRAFTGKNAGIKWPNDVVLDEKKLCGILTETSAEADRIKFVVLGIGVNVNSEPSKLPSGAASLAGVAGAPVNRIDFARALLEALDGDYRRLCAGEFDDLAREWEEFSVTSGRRVIAKRLDRTLQGQATGIDRDGALWIRTDEGLQERLLAGDIQHLRPS